MKPKISFDVSGLAWKYKSGVQNLVWAYVMAFIENPELYEKCEVLFYDRTGLYNKELAQIAKTYYSSMAPSWWPRKLTKLLRLVDRYNFIPKPNISGSINHVNNWNIYHKRNARASITIPDILPLEYPEWFDRQFIKQTENSLLFAKNEAEFVFCISEYVKQKLVEKCGIQANRINVAYPGIAPTFFTPVSHELQNDVLEKYGLEKERYVISSGYLDPRKNLKRQIEAFHIFAGRTNSEIKYVLTGAKTALSHEILSMIDSPDLRERILFLGYVSSDDLRVLIGASACVMYCSLAEGFGLPIIEAMAMNRMVITSDTTSMTEIGRGRAILVNPIDVEDMAKAIGRVIEISTSEKQVITKKNHDYAREFTIANWMQSHVKKMLD